MKISVIVPSYNSQTTLALTLEGLLKQPSRYLEEIIVVDSSEDKKTKELLKKFSGKIRVVDLEPKTMPAIARNIGAAKATGETLAFIDSDAFPAEDWLEKIALARREGSRVGGGAVLLPEFQKRNLLAWAQYFLQFNEFMGAGPQRRVGFVPSCNLFCKKKLFMAAGGFPEIRASEDVLFGRLANQFSTVMFHPEIKVHHVFRSRLDAYLKNQVLLGKYILIYRRMGRRKFLYTAWMVIPLFPVFIVIKFFRMLSRIVVHKNNLRPFLTAFPLFILGLFYWAIGFFQGAFEPQQAVWAKR